MCVFWGFIFVVIFFSLSLFFFEESLHVKVRSKVKGAVCNLSLCS